MPLCGTLVGMNIGKRFSTVGVVVILSIATLALLVFWFLNQSIGGFYHPNAIEGNYGTKYLWVFELAVFLNWLYIIYIAIRGASETKLRKLGISAVILLLLVDGFYLAALVPRAYHAEYFLGQEKYSIPWQYNPINGSDTPGGKYFVVHVSYPGFTGQYSDEGYYQHQLTLAKCIFDEKEKIGTSLDEMCYEETCGGLSYASNTYFVDNGFVYHIHYQGDTVVFHNRDELNAFKKSIVDLFDSLKAR